LDYQFVEIQPAQGYELSGWVAASGAAMGGAFLRISWFDAGGQPVLQDDSPGLPQRDGNFYRLTTGARVSPAAARSARTSLYILGNPNTPFEVHLDDFAFSGPGAIPPPPPTQPPPTTPPPVITPTPQPPAATPTRTPRRTPTPVRTSAPQQPDDVPGGAPASPAEEPMVFGQLVNGGFEELRADGSPYGWRKQGGEILSVGEPRTEGVLAAALSSQTTSTKWIFQTVMVRGGAHYEASVDARAGPGSESVFLRLSWYANADGSGSAIDSVDSLATISPAEARFTRLTTGVVEAPPSAATVKVRLMLRPSSEEPAVAYFDFVALLETSADVSAPVARGRTESGTIFAAGRDGGAESLTEGNGSVGPAGGTPVRLANVKPPELEAGSSLASGDGSGDDWAIMLALGIALSAIGIAGGHELWQRRHRTHGVDADGED
jgi:hypothetical protein